jgi:hypothetical protein
MAWKGHLWMTIMYSGMPMKFRLKSGGYIGLPIMFLSVREFMSPSGAMTTINISLASGSGSATSNGTTRSGGTTKGGGAWASTSIWGPLLVFNLVVKFFHELWQNYEEVRIEKLRSLQDFQRSPMRVYKKPMHNCVG